MRIRWKEGNDALREAVEGTMAAPEQAEGAQRLAASRHRETWRVDLPGLDQQVVVKRFLPPSRHPGWLRRALEWARLTIGHAAAQKEWRNAKALDEAGIPIPEPLAFARLSDGSAWLVSRFLCEARPLADALDGYPFELRRRMREVGALVNQLHSAGFSHHDLHVGNVMVSEKAAWLIDLQRVEANQRTSDRIPDIAFLDFSLHHAGASLASRLRFRAAALGLSAFRIASERELLREVGRASHRRAVDYYRERTRKTLRPGKRYARYEAGERRGMRVCEIEDEIVSRMLEAHAGIVEAGGPARLKCDHRSNVTRVEVAGRTAIVKEVVKRSARKRLADAFRGSPARRGWLAGHGLLLRGIGAARPLAFAEIFERRLPVASWLILEDLGASPCVAGLDRDAAVDVGLGRRLLGLLRRLHRAEVVHGDLQALHIHLVDGRPTLIDLEGVRFLYRLHDRHRIKMLCELNASLADEVIPAAERCDLLDRYLLALPFDRGNARATGEIVRRSLARGQRWRGEGCELSRRSFES